MNDNQFQKALDKATKKLNEYHSALKIVENEYQRRFGVHPSDIDDDDWIDSMHVTGSGTTVEQVKMAFELHIR
jgi:hypothetical protein